MWAKLSRPSPKWIAFLLFGVLVLSLMFRRLEVVQDQAWTGFFDEFDTSALPCDPYSEPGHLFSSDDLFASRYVIYNDPALARSLSPGGDWVVPSYSAQIHGKLFGQLEFMRNRTVLILGDSIDRNLVIHFGRRVLAGTQGRHFFHRPPDGSAIPAVKLGAHEIGVAELPELNFTLYNFFLMGLSVQEEVAFFHPREDLPQRFEERLKTLFLPHIRQRLLPRPDLIILNTGFWDLEFMARRRAAHYSLPGVSQRAYDGPTNLESINRGDGNPMSLTELAYHRTRLRSLVRFLQDQFRHVDRTLGIEARPVQFMYRAMHLGGAHMTNAFGQERVMQLDQSNRLVMAEFSIPVIEWTKHTIGLDYQLNDKTIHYGIGSAQYIFGDMMLFYLKQVVWGERDEWEGCQWIRRRQIQRQHLNPPS